MFIRPQQNATLNHKFNINDTAATLFQVYLAVVALVQLTTHSVTHLPDFLV